MSKYLLKKSTSSPEDSTKARRTKEMLVEFFDVNKIEPQQALSAMQAVFAELIRQGFSFEEYTEIMRLIVSGYKPLWDVN